MSEAITFTIDQPQVIHLKYATGKEIQGNYGPRMMFTAADGRVMFFDLEVGARINELRLKPGEPVLITARRRADGKKGVAYEVARQAVVAAAAPPPAPVAAPTSALAPQTAADELAGNGFLACYLASIDTLLAAQRYAATKGWNLQFGPEDVRSAAAALFIECGKHTASQHFGDTRPARVNGGTTWQQ